MQGKWHYLAALKVQPANAEAHKRLANALAAQRRAREAVPHLQKAACLNQDPQTRLELASLLYQNGELRRAVAELRRVVALKPDLAVGFNNLAWLLATCSDEGVRDGPEAVRCAERACHLTKFEQTMMVGTLAASYAEAGRLTEAVATAETAVKMGTAAAETRYVAVNQQLSRRYREGKPLHEPAMPGQGR